MKSLLLALAAALVLPAGCRDSTVAPSAPAANAQSIAAKSGYAPAGPLNIYYEVHGRGEPVLLIHGAISTIDTSFGTILPELAKTRQVIAIESQGHGHTADIDRPLTFEQMGDDAAAVLRHLKIAKADVVGYSDGGNVALALTLRHPALVRKVAVVGTNYNNGGLVPEVLKHIEAGAKMTEAELLASFPPQFQKAYAEVAPKPVDFAKVGLKVMKQGANFRGWTPQQLAGIASPLLVVVADQDIVPPEHATEMRGHFRNARLAVIPGRDHITIVERSETLRPILVEFLNAPPVPFKIPVSDSQRK